MTSDITFLDHSNWQQADWSQSIEKKNAFAYLTPLFQKGVQSYIQNVDTELFAVHLDNHVLPITVNQQEYGNSYVCSPFNQYVTYAREELGELKSPILEATLHHTLSLMGAFLKWGKINRVVMVNNWMISTNLYPDINEEQIATLTEQLIRRFPNHAIVFRSITDHHPQLLLDRLLAQGYVPIPSRQVYYYDPERWQQLTSKQRSLIRRERRKLRESGYHLQKGKKWSDEELQTFIQLYNQLYLEKYSYHNPQINKDILELAVSNRLMRLGALVKDDERIDGVYGYYICNGAMIAPLFGYRTELPQKTGLYRLLSTAVQQEAHRHKLLQHVSSGGAQFKRDRGAYERIEYTLVYTRHLPFLQRQTWTNLHHILMKVAVPMLQERKL